MKKFRSTAWRNVARGGLRSGAAWLVGAAALAFLASGALASPLADANGVQTAQPRYVQLAGLFGDDEEEKAAQQREQAQDSSLAELRQRVGDLEDTLRRLTGQVEEANHRADVLQQRMIRMQKDFDYKLCTLTAQQLGAASSDEDGDQMALPCGTGAGPGSSQQSVTATPSGSAMVGGAPAASPSGDSQPVRLSPPPGVLGTLPVGTEVPRPLAVQPPAASATQPQFDSARNLLARAQYDEARAAFRSFADAYPSDELTPQAVYWVGAIAYVQKDYPGAARAFAEEIKKYPTSPHAPESMLKLGQSLIAMNQKEEGCTALGALATKYPKATKTLIGQARSARKDAGCR